MKPFLRMPYRLDRYTVNGDVTAKVGEWIFDLTCENARALRDCKHNCFQSASGISIDTSRILVLS